MEPGRPMSQLPIGGRYRLREEIGRGASSVVYRARDEQTGQDVAVKLADYGLPAGAETPVPLLPQHPNIVRIREILPDTDSGTCVVMDLVRGSHLWSLMSDGPVAEPWVRFVLEEVAVALAHAHHHGVVHGDLRPANVVIERSDEGMTGVKVAGFEGSMLAALAGPGGPRLRRTSAFSAPEQRVGGPVGPQADVYALGAMMWHAATGVPHRTVKTPAPTKPLPADLEQVLRRCLEPLPGERYADGCALLSAIRGERIKTPMPVGFVPPPSDPPPDRRRGVVLALGLAAVALGAAVALLVIGWGGPQRGTDLDGPALEALPERQPLTSLRPEAREVDALDDAPTAVGVDSGGPSAAAPIGSTDAVAAAGAAPDEPTDTRPRVARSGVSSESTLDRPSGSSSGRGTGASVDGPTALRADPDRTSRPSGADSPPAGEGVADVPTPAEAESGDRPDVADAPAGTSDPEPAAAGALASGTGAPTLAAPAPDAPAARPSMVSSLAGLSTWVGEIGGRPAQLVLDVAPDGSATGTLSARVGADTLDRPVAGTVREAGGQVVVALVESGRSRQARYSGVIEEGVGRGRVTVNGRQRASWMMSQL